MKTLQDIKQYYLNKIDSDYELQIKFIYLIAQNDIFLAKMLSKNTSKK